MDFQSDKLPGLGLPQPSLEQANVAHMPEVASAGTEMPPVASAPMVASAPLPSPLPTTNPMPQTMAQPTPPAAALSATPVDDNSDDLDEEWVNKAKAIVERTRTDPFTESRELGKVKADYLKIRYNKHIKVAEDQSQ